MKKPEDPERCAYSFRKSENRISYGLPYRLGLGAGLSVASTARAMNWKSFWRGWTIRKSSILSERERKNYWMEGVEVLKELLFVGILLCEGLGSLCQ